MNVISSLIAFGFGVGTCSLVLIVLIDRWKQFMRKRKFKGTRLYRFKEIIDGQWEECSYRAANMEEAEQIAKKLNITLIG